MRGEEVGGTQREWGSTRYSRGNGCGGLVLLLGFLLLPTVGGVLAERGRRGEGGAGLAGIRCGCGGIKQGGEDE